MLIELVDRCRATVIYIKYKQRPVMFIDTPVPQLVYMEDSEEDPDVVEEVLGDCSEVRRRVLDVDSFKLALSWLVRIHSRRADAGWGDIFW